jgi:drug/metabolite transporter (DMT)-like permease
MSDTAASSNGETRARDTSFGIAAILIWSCNIAISRSLAEKLGAITAASCMLLAGGLVGCAWEGLVRRRMRSMLRLPRVYLLACGSTFVAYMACLYLAIGLASSRQQTLEVGMLNYLWPALTLVLAVPLLGMRVRWTFPVGVALAFAGGTIVPLRPGQGSISCLFDNLKAHPWPYVLAVAAAVLWALYSNFSRRFAGASKDGAVPLFVVASGVALSVLRLFVHESSHWSLQGAAELSFMAVLPTLLAYSFWDRAMRRGNVTLVAALSYLIPVSSTLLSSVYLQVPVEWNVWAACAMIVAGACLCRLGARGVGHGGGRLAGGRA